MAFYFENPANILCFSPFHERLRVCLILFLYGCHGLAEAAQNTLFFFFFRSSHGAALGEFLECVQCDSAYWLEWPFLLLLTPLHLLSHIQTGYLAFHLTHLIWSSLNHWFSPVSGLISDSIFTDQPRLKSASDFF